MLEEEVNKAYSPANLKWRDIQYRWFSRIESDKYKTGISFIDDNYWSGLGFE